MGQVQPWDRHSGPRHRHRLAAGGEEGTAEQTDFFLSIRCFRDTVHHLGVVTDAGKLSTWRLEEGGCRV